MNLCWFCNALLAASYLTPKRVRYHVYIQYSIELYLSIYVSLCRVNTNIREARSHLCTEIVDRKTSEELKVVAVVDVDLT